MTVSGRGSFAEIDVGNLCKSYTARKNGHRAVDNLSLTVDTRTALGIVGESGSGKSTLVRMMCGLEKRTSGQVTFNGLDLEQMLSTPGGRREFRSKVQYVAQDTSSSFDPRRTLRDAVRLPALRLLGMDRKSADERVDETLHSLSLNLALADRYPSEVSGGQRQRFSIARALVVRPRLLLCDEVVSALDVSVQGSILNMLREYRLDADCGLVFVSHGLPATAFISDEIMVMRSGTIVERGTTDDIVERPSDPYTEQLLEAYRGIDELEEFTAAVAR